MRIALLPILLLVACGPANGDPDDTGEPTEPALPLLTGTPTLLATWDGDPYAVRSLVADADTVWWIHKDSHEILTVPRTGGDITVRTTAPEFSTSIAVDADVLYWGSAAGLNRLDPGASSPTVVCDTQMPAGGVRFLTGLALGPDVAVFSSKRLDDSAGALVRVGRDGADPTVLVDETGVGLPVIVGDEVLYLASDGTSLAGVPLAGGEGRVLTAVGLVASVFHAGERVYIAGTEEPNTQKFSVRSMPLAGGALEEEMNATSVVAFTRDAGWYYWIDLATTEILAYPRAGDGGVATIHDIGSYVALFADDNGLVWFDGAELWALPRTASP